jgi:hypothetical protein
MNYSDGPSNIIPSEKEDGLNPNSISEKGELNKQIQSETEG